MDIVQIIEKLNTFISPSGNEKEILKYVYNEIKDYCDDLSYDAMGNLITVIGKGKGEKVMFSAHADTIGFISYFADDKGFLKISPLGGINMRTFVGRRIKFVNGIEGALCYETETKEQEMKYCFVDIGAENKHGAEKMVPIGTAGSIVGDVVVFGKDKDYLMSPFLDNRISVAIQILLIKKLYEEKVDLKNEIYFVFSVQEEIGLRGARTSSYAINPKYGLAIDVTLVSDTPKSGFLPMKINEGACIKVMDASIYCHDSMVKFLTNVAKEKGIKHQMEVLYAGGTDAGQIHLAKEGAISGGISIPTRYIHTPVETVSIKDCEDVLNLSYEAVKTGFTF